MSFRLINGPSAAKATVILAHGAGAAMDHPFLDAISLGLAAANIRVVRFEFPYMALRRADQKRRPPDRMPVLLETWRDEIARLRAEGGGPDGSGTDGTGRLFIGGKSMGGRVASMVADEVGVSGLLCLGYPFHPPKTPDRLRTEHLEKLTTDCLIIQGTRDVFGTRQEVSGYKLSPSIGLHWIEAAGHDLVPLKSSGRSSQDAEAEIIQAMTDFIFKSG